MTDARIFHLAVPEDWDAARLQGSYRMSTRGRTLEDEGFIHCSTDRQLAGTANRFYGDLDRLTVLNLDVSRLGAEVRWEPPAPGSHEVFPHIYGPIPLEAVVATTEWVRSADSWDWSAR